MTSLPRQPDGLVLPPNDPTDPMSYLHRAQLVQTRIQRISSQAKRCSDPERMALLHAEMDLLHEAMLTIREEQIIAQMNGWKKPKTRRRWWRRSR